MNIKTPILIASIIGSSILFILPAPYGGISAIALLAAMAVILTGLELMHPFTWYVPIFTLYALADPILNLYYDFGHWENSEGTAEALFANWIALTTFCLIVGVRKYGYDKDRLLYNLDLKNTKVISSGLLGISGLFFSYYVFNIWRSGLINKVEIREFGGLTILYSFITIVFVSYCVYMIRSIILEKKVPGLFIISFMLWVSICFLITGERDILIRVIWITVFVLHVLYKPISRKVILIAASLGVLAIPILQELKNFGLSGQTRGFLSNNIILDVLRSEFSSASKNLRVLIDAFDMNYFLGQTLLWDIQRAFLGGDMSGGKWFGETFYPDALHGQGFTIVGEGFVNFGYYGVVIWFLIIGLSVRWLYKRSVDSPWRLALYVISMPIFVYVVRADMAYLMSAVVKQTVFILIVIYILKNILQSMYRTIRSQ